MMRALGFQKNHVLVFVILQAFSFAIPGVLFGLMIALVLNEGFEEFMFIALDNAGTYGLTAASIVAIIILFGFFVPVFSIVGPTREALGRNLRVSLDPSRRNGANEGVSASVNRLGELAYSGREILMSLFLILFGLMTYYIVPSALLNSQFGVFFFVMNFVLTGLCIGFVLMAVIIMHTLQKGILRCLLCCRPNEKKLGAIIEKRLETARGSNIKIAIMVTVSIAFLIF
mmetsp:Transcript_6434/g.8612  ORF Transcript_6434/g.8612 Transcript_6434/m.8612 type:complete len:229 (+) Transcript_6434:1687-2373(+)